VSSLHQCRYGTPCQHEHAYIRCPVLHIDPRMLARLDDLETDLVEREGRAQTKGWLGEIEGIELTLSFPATSSLERNGSHLHTLADCRPFKP
jgi:hypothetical protein